MNANIAGKPVSPFGARLVGALALGATLNPINSTMISVALVPIALAFNASATEISWLIASLYLSSAIAQPAMGTLAGIFGPRKIYLVSLGIVALAGLGGLLASTMPLLIACRTLLGIGTSGTYPAAMTIFRLLADKHRTRIPRLAMSVLAMTALGFSAVGPLVGGILTEIFGWHSVFTANLPIALLTMVLVILWVPRDSEIRTAPAGTIADIDFVGILLFSALLSCGMLFVMDLRDPNWWTLPAALIAAVWFVSHSLRSSRPFIDIRMLRTNPPLFLSYLRGGLLVVPAYCMLFGFPQWLVGSAGLSAAQAGLVTIPMSTLSVITALAAARLRNVRRAFVIVAGASICGCLAFLFVDTSTPLWLVAAAALLFSPALGMASTATQAAIFVQAPVADMGTASGLQRSAQYVGAMGSAGLIGLAFGDRVTDAGLHALALSAGGLTLFLLFWILADRTIPDLSEL